jgi:parallel beta-helix repeat protein
MSFYDSSNRNFIIANTISKNGCGITLIDTSDNIFHHNNIIENTYQLNQKDNLMNIWDDGNGVGNYWSDYNGIDSDDDGIGDTKIPHQGVDHYPLTDRREDKEDSFVPWILLLLWLAVITIIVILSQVIKKRKPPKSPPESESQIDLPIQPKF